MGFSQVGTTRDIKVNVVDNQVYYGGSQQDGTIQSMALPELQSMEFLQGADRVFIYGTAANASLVLRVYTWLNEQTGRRPKVYLGGVPVGRKPSKATPETLLRRMDSVEFGSGGNGWHRLTDDDVDVYQLVDAIARQGYQADHAYVQALLRKHPAWPALEYLPGVDLPSAAMLLAEIVDPRWFFDPETTRISNRLREHFGVGEKKADLQRMRYVVESPEAAAMIYKRLYSRVSGLVHAWAGRGEGGLLARVRQFEERPEELLRPRMFLWRMACAEQPFGYAQGFLKASHVFLRFLTTVWLANIMPHRELMVPEYFFAGDSEVASDWSQYYAGYQRRHAS